LSLSLLTWTDMLIGLFT